MTVTFKGNSGSGVNDPPEDQESPWWMDLQRWTGYAVLTFSSVLLLASQYSPRLQSCAGPEQKTCVPLELGDITPLFVLGLLLAVPAWTEISVATIGLKRELAAAREETEELREVVDLRTFIEQISAQTAVTTPSAQALAEEERTKRRILDELRGLADDLRTVSAGEAVAPGAKQRATTIARTVRLAASNPDRVTLEELERVRQEAQALVTALA